MTTTNSGGVIKCFIPQTISSDVKLRQKVLSVFNKRRSDFPNEAKYNDYLEHVEEIVFNAIEGIASATETEKILQKEKREHAKEIKERKERNMEEDRVSCPEKFNVVFGGGGGGVGSMHGYYGGSMEGRAGMAVPALPTPAPYERGRVVHKYEI